MRRRCTISFINQRAEPFTERRLSRPGGHWHWHWHWGELHGQVAYPGGGGRVAACQVDCQSLVGDWAESHWAQASLGNAALRGNIVSRDMWDWQKGHQYKFDDCFNDAQKAMKLARGSGLKNTPDLTRGSHRVLQRPDSGRIKNTKAYPSDGSRLIVAEASKASAEKPLLVIAGGPMTTVANALLSNPEIGPNLVVFNLTVASHGYNGKDSWSPYIVAKRARLVAWATGTFWHRNSVFTLKDFEILPRRLVRTTGAPSYCQSSFRQLSNLRDEAHVLTLEGHVPSCFLKQVAQTVLLRELEEAVVIDNRMEVAYD